ncbi:glycoside hydrolase family 32 protein [uncultured Muriicola sp.]|uniref:glycoside hydrolase family 32 protein n=1 Tax=uncultured Muriicola sp. TaxID=1583102 RepID=UPI0026292519|nr:glycoside hydrolase family 32 protein [uncultured Muriicola sp.]
MMRITVILFSISLVLVGACKEAPNLSKKATEKTLMYQEQFRPQYHFSPPEKWMNDPNGLLYNQGVYHLFYQFYPEDIVWGPMHWGHATSTDMLHWENKPIALYPDKHGLIFSGSAVLDENNTSGLGTAKNPPLVAIFTYHDMDKEKAGSIDFQTQGVAYSLDNGESFTMYEGNPVLLNSEFKDFRDPKVFWDKKTGQWVMALVAGDHLRLYRSDNLLEWTYMSRFGATQGAHGGVWECPDLFELQVEGIDESKWVLLISINPGAPNGGSGTQYFVGDYDGTTFISDQEEIKWLDWGTDNYAGVTYNNTPDNKRLFIGWMSNWNYARETPTEAWRSAMTLPRILSLSKINDTYELFNYPIPEVDSLLLEETTMRFAIPAGGHESIGLENGNQSEILFTTAARDLKVTFKNEQGQQLILEMDGTEKLCTLDRSQSGLTDFQETFAGSQQMPLNNLPGGEVEFRIFLDASSIEVFINKGQYTMTAQIFPTASYSDLEIGNTGTTPSQIQDFAVKEVAGIW